RRRGIIAEPTLIIGTGQLALELGTLMAGHPELGLRPIGFVDYLPPGPDAGLPLLGPPEAVAEIARRCDAQRVIGCYPGVDGAVLVQALRALRTLPAQAAGVPRLYERGAR